MRAFVAVLAVGIVAVALTGCAGVAQAPVVPPVGLLYTSVSAPLDVDAAKSELGTKVGKASTRCILGLVATGDASTAAAARAGGLTTINHADYESRLYVFGIYSSYTTVVYGN